MELAREQDLMAFEALMRRHNRRLFRVARTILRDADAAEDAVQEAYLRAFTKLAIYKPTGQVQCLADPRGAQRGADDAPARARRHGVARRNRRRSRECTGPGR